MKHLSISEWESELMKIESQILMGECDPDIYRRADRVRDIIRDLYVYIDIPEEDWYPEDV